MSRSLPTREEMLAHALVSLEQARGALSDVRDWLPRTGDRSGRR
jgi:hypothetical protein